ncbi:uncharacterized protein SCHCODRAFT_01082006 [Schizophyllum commune H4-8]|uniref:uncharacterized protein n=1 Tax=Schizophyllum commune (strain H4-8 / FGSC 9210) TaxID=578458 RepID=UPI0021601263|nr:uncharacterized protein SCHCODRAFT_01082006 [Schizophyllum commune H4-8]KAI5894254.1 hypothetical protein SCHCODRAFT_01082006 [Schizophyllum commune H4-8]
MTPLAHLALYELPEDILDYILFVCSPADLQCLRATNVRFSALIDKGRYLEAAIQRAQLPPSLAICERFSDATQHLPACLKPINKEDTIWYRLLLAGGSCTACEKFAGGPPLSSNLRIRLCGEYDCMARVCRNEFTAPNWTIDFPNDYLGLAEINSYIPYMNDFDNINHCAIRPEDDQSMFNRCRYLRKKYDQAYSGTEHWDNLRLLHKALEPFHFFLSAWRHHVATESRPIFAKNLEDLEKFVNKKGQTLKDALKDPLVQRVLAAHVRDKTPIYRATLANLHCAEPDKALVPSQSSVAVQQQSACTKSAKQRVKAPSQASARPLCQAPKGRQNPAPTRGVVYRCAQCIVKFGHGSTAAFRTPFLLNKHHREVHSKAIRGIQ